MTVKARYNVTVPLDEPDYEHLESLVEKTGLTRTQIVRAALKDWNPESNHPEIFLDQDVAQRRWETELAVRLSGGNLSLAGRLLGIGPSAVFGRITRYKLVVQRKRGRPSNQHTPERQLKEIERSFNEQRNLRLLGGGEAAQGDSGARGSGSGVN